MATSPAPSPSHGRECIDQQPRAVRRSDTRRLGEKAQFLINFTQPTTAVRGQIAKVYLPKLNKMQEYDIRAYKDVAQKLFLLGFGIPATTWRPTTKSAT